MRKHRKRQRQRRGAAVVEFALIVPVMLTFTFGMIELSRMSMVKESLTQATREGARVGVRPTADSADVVARVNEELDIMGLSGATLTITPQVLEQAEPGDYIHVKLTIPISETSWIPDVFSFEVLDIEAETVMRRESTG
ncbi:pilus assembly protein [Roseiconus nitratireducens]|uniref:Pilus assembly protein n=1 Tax=Roseiconus nitratireducens TaxID=2605748 RepID=A0A5M6D2W8_9BACT|nr:TadE family protein [Roseiconus nitratireducens]KAA5540019.1 pilus assembly protein [Roseiconus nitratireducens]